jgi:hypothetical protein
MIDKVRERAAALRAQWDAQDADLKRDAERMNALLSEIVSALSASLIRQTEFQVELDFYLEDCEPEQGWVDARASVTEHGVTNDRRILTIEARVEGAKIDFTVEGQGTDAAYLGGQPFEVAYLSSRDAAVGVAADVIVETLAQWLARGATILDVNDARPR